MPMTLEQIVEETRQRPEDTVAELVDRIILAKHGGITKESETAWASVTSARSTEIDSGNSPLIPGSDGTAFVRKIVGR